MPSLLPVLREHGVEEAIQKLKDDFPDLKDTGAALQCFKNMMEDLYTVDIMIMPCFPITLRPVNCSRSSSLPFLCAVCWERFWRSPTVSTAVPSLDHCRA